MDEQPPLEGFEWTAITGTGWPALIICLEPSERVPQGCGGWVKAADADEAAAWLDEHSRRYHEGRPLRFEVWSRRPTDLDALIQPTTAPPLEVEHWTEGPYEPPR